MPTVDHYALAEQYLSAAEDSRLADAPDEAYERTATAAVHAHLAIADQLRTANLIALFQMEGGPYKEINHWTDGENDARNVVVTEIKEGLGL